VTRGADDPIRVGVLGTGAISQIVHLPILSEREDVEVVAVSDEDEHKARTIAQRFGVPRVISDAEMMADSEVEAVFLCTPNHLHEEQAVAALEGAKHVLVERPLALTPAGCDRIVAAADEASRTVVVGMSHRFRPDVAALRSFVAGGELGELYSVSGAWLNRTIPLAQTTWRQRPEQAGGGALMDLGVQALDLCLWLLDYPVVRAVRAIVYADEYEVEEAATLLAKLEGGVALSLEVSWGYFAGEDLHQVRLMGTEGSGSLPPLEIYKQLGGRPLEVTPRQPLPRGGENPYTNAYRREIDYFVRAILGEWDAELPREQAVLMGLVQAAYRSVEEGREVEL
jgi:predicted dehydrogenase